MGNRHNNTILRQKTSYLFIDFYEKTTLFYPENIAVTLSQLKLDFDINNIINLSS